MKEKFLKLLIIVTIGGLLLSACAPSATPTAAPVSPTSAPVSPTSAPVSPQPTNSSQAETGTIYIAAVYPMTGDNALYGQDEVQAHKYVIDKVNAAGGINGRMIELDVFDDAGDPQQAANVAQKLVGDPKYVAGFGHFMSVDTLAAAPIYNDGKFLFLTDSVNAKLSGISPWMFRYSITDREAGRQLVWAAIKNHPEYKKVAILFDQSDFGVGQKDTITGELKALGVDIVDTESYVAGQSKDFSPQLTKIKSTTPDVIFIAGYFTEAAEIAQQMHQLGMNQTIWGPDGLNDVGLIKLGGKDVEGVRVVSYFSENATYPGIADTVKEYQAKWNVKPDGISAITLDATQLLIDGIKAVGTDRDKLREWLSTEKDFVGISGPIQFDQNHDNLRRIVVIEVQNGQFVVSKDQVPQLYYDTEFGK